MDSSEKAKNNFAVPLAIVLVFVLIIPFSSAGFLSDAWKKITGEATNTVVINITVGGPSIYFVDNNTSPSITAAAIGLSSGPANTSIIINFSVSLASGANNLNNATATINFSKAGESLRQNSSCSQIISSGTLANYTCNVTMSWYDGSGTWAIQAFIADTNGNSGKNNSANFSVGQTTGFQMGSLSWGGLAPGQTNQSSSAPLTLNNTGNKPIAANATQINATSLVGETTTTLAINVSNISISWDATALAACDISTVQTTNMTLNNATLMNITTANLTKGNYLLNDGSTGQEQYYFCIRNLRNDLTSQQYSTSAKGPWQVAIFSMPFALLNIRKRKLKIKNCLKSNKTKNDS